MFGFIIGTLSLVGLIKVWRWGRHGHGRGGFTGPRRWMLRRLFERLDTTPGQEKVILQAVDEVERKAWAARDGVFQSRGAVAAAMRGEHFDGAAVGEAFEQEQARIDEVKKAVREGMARVHEALTPEQRALVGDLLEFGPARMHHGCGHHRHHGRTGPAEAVSL